MAKLHMRENIDRETWRLAVPGGWLYGYHTGSQRLPVFVPDPTAEHVKGVRDANIIKALREIVEQMAAARDEASVKRALAMYDTAQTMLEDLLAGA